MEAQLRPHLGHIVFQRSNSDGRWRIGHLVTGEVVELPEPSGKWDIVYDAEGFAFLVDDGQRTLAVDDCLEVGLYPVGGKDIIDPEDERHQWELQFLDDDLSKFDTLSAELDVGLEAKRVRIDITCFRQARRLGQRCFWSIADFYFGLTFSSLYQGHASRWYGARWKSWDAQLTAWGMPDSLIKSVRRQVSDTENRSGSLDRASTGTFGFIGLLAGRAFTGLGMHMREPTHRAQCEAMLLSWCGPLAAARCGTWSSSPGRR